MEVTTIASHFLPTSRISSSHTTSRLNSLNCKPISSSSRNFLSTNFVAPFLGTSSSKKVRPDILNPFYSSGSPASRSVVTMVIPFSKGTAWEQPPPDLASYLFKNRIIYLGMTLVPSVTELLVAEFMYLQDDSDTKPIYLYINSTGTTKRGEQLSYDSQALAVYDVMAITRSPVFTLCVGNAWGEAALLLAAGTIGNRSALPSTTIMIRQPMSRFQGQATDINIMRRAIETITTDIIQTLSDHTGQSVEQIREDTRQPKYFTPSEAVEYGLIDKVLYTERQTKDRGVLASLRSAKLI